MIYPEALIPQLHFKKIAVELRAHWLCRTVPNPGLLQPENGKFAEAAFYQNWEEFYDYSTNLPGHFRMEDNYLTLCGTQKKHFQADWDFVEEIANAPVFEQDFIFDPSKGVFFLPIAAVHRKIQCPFSRPPKNVPDILTAVVAHTPARANFWHFSLRWEDANGQIVKPSDSKWKEERVATMRAFLSELLETAVPTCLPLPESDFCK